MKYLLSRAPTFFILALITLINFSMAGCRKQPSDAGNTPVASPTSTGIAGKYVAGVKRSDDVIELFRLDINRQGNDINGVLDFLSSMLDSIEGTNPQKLDLQVFEN